MTKDPIIYLDHSFREKYPDVAWKKMAGMRDKLIHDYLGVDLWAVWGVVEAILPEQEDSIVHNVQEPYH